MQKPLWEAGQTRQQYQANVRKWQQEQEVVYVVPKRKTKGRKADAEEAMEATDTPDTELGEDVAQEGS